MAAGEGRIGPGSSAGGAHAAGLVQSNESQPYISRPAGTKVTVTRGADCLEVDIPAVGIWSARAGFLFLFSATWLFFVSVWSTLAAVPDTPSVGGDVGAVLRRRAHQLGP